MLVPRSEHAVAELDGKIYAIGGYPSGRVPSDVVQVYDVAADRWTTLPNLPTQRNHLAVVAIERKVYVAGGRFGGGFNSEKTAALEIYDPATNRWTAGAPLPAPRGGVAGVSANGCVYVVGGEGNTNDPRGLFDQNEAYDPQANVWNRLPPMPTPTHGLVGAAFVDGRIYLPGGAVTQGGGSGSVIHWVYRPRPACR